MTELFVTKRDGRKEPLDIEKVHQVVMWACDGVVGVSPSEVEGQAQLKIVNGMKTSELHQSLVEAAHELISMDGLNYDLVAGRLAMFDIRKQVYGKFEPDSLLDIVRENVKDGWYDKELESLYTDEQWGELDKYIKHDRDFNFRFAAIKEWRNKYLVQDRVKKELKETPQVAYMLISAVLMKKYVADEGLKIVKDYYDALSLGDTTLPTPVLAGVRTPTRQFASCTVLEVGDSLDSITASVDAIVKYASRKAGLGIGVYNLRAEKQKVRNGEATTTGPIPFTQMLQSAVLSCSQGGLRKGSATFFHNIWHKDVEKLLVLKNNRGTEETRVRHSDHGFNINGYLWRKMMKGEDMYLFSPEDFPDLQKAFFEDSDKFAELYEKYSRSRKATKVSAASIRDTLITERIGTGRIYIHNVDNANQQGSFMPDVAPIRQSNLCVEIELPTSPLEKFDDENALISLCTLSAINWGRIRKPEDFEKPMRLAVMALDSLLDYQDYPLKASKNSTDWYRSLGIGVNDFAHFLAKRGLKYGEPETLEVVDEYMEAMSYYGIRASVELAKRYGACGKVENTKYSLGITPKDARKKAVDELVVHKERFDWITLQEELKLYGIRNATLFACMPSETSSRVMNLTNGVEPIRDLITIKDGTSIVAPEAERLKNKYEITWDIDAENYLKTMAVIQKWMDQGISINTTYDPSNFPDGKLSGALIFKHMLLAYKYGLKTMYYNNNNKVASQEVPQEVEKELPPVDDAECESCTL